METLAVVISAFSVLITIIAMLLWLRTEANTDRRQIAANMDTLRGETNALVNAIREDIREFRAETYAEMKDFHGRLCAIEERRK